MFLPKFKARLSNLHTYYTDVFRLVDFLKKDLFTGYIQILGEEKELMVFLDTGQIIKCLDNIDDEYRDVTLKHLLDKISTEEIVNVFTLPENTVLFWANIFVGTPLYSNLSTEFTDTNRLIQKLKRENLTGWMEVNLANNGKSIVYFQNGEIIGTCSSWHKWFFQEGSSFLLEIIQKVSQATFDVYKLPLEKTLENNLNVENILAFFQEFMSILENAIGEREFALLWRQKAINKADNYPFLDPFANEFEYKDGKIIYEGIATEKELVNGLKEICMEIIKEKRLKEKIALKMKELKERHRHFLEETGLLQAFESVK